MAFWEHFSEGMVHSFNNTFGEVNKPAVFFFGDICHMRSEIYSTSKFFFSSYDNDKTLCTSDNCGVTDVSNEALFWRWFGGCVLVWANFLHWPLSANVLLLLRTHDLWSLCNIIRVRPDLLFPFRFTHLCPSLVQTNCVKLSNRLLERLVYIDMVYWLSETTVDYCTLYNNTHLASSPKYCQD